MICIIPARLNSKRLPNKHMINILGINLLDRVYDQVKKSKLITKIVIAIPDDDKNLILETHLKSKKIEYFKGSLVNLSKRIFDLIKIFKCKYFLRVNGDSPLIDYKLIDHCIKIFKNKNCDILTNALPRTFPKGQSIEIIKTSVFNKNFSKIKTKHDLEHVFPYYYKNKKKFKIMNVICKKDLSHFNFCIDKKSDIKRIIKILIDLKNKKPFLENLVKKKNLY
jgi:spore coat polysaccharide biosynthesis protein SpsF